MVSLGNQQGLCDPAKADHPAIEPVGGACYPDQRSPGASSRQRL